MKLVRNLKEWEIDEFCNLLQCPDSKKLNDTRDMRVWKPYEKKGFSMKSIFTVLYKRDSNSFSKVAPFKQIWKSRAPSRVVFLLGKLRKNVF